jgi:aspartate/methionine/tyrosine aminotransferase
MVLSDEIYEHLVFPPHQFTSFASLSPQAFERTLTINGFSKAFSMTGWRLGYGAGPTDLIEAMNLIQGQSTSGPNSIAQAAAEAALDLEEDFFKSHQEELLLLKQEMTKGLKAAPSLKWGEPEGTFYLFIDISAYKNKKTPQGQLIQSSEDLALYLLEEALVATVAGSGFGNDDFLRLSFAVSMDEIKKGTSQITQALNQLA